MLGKLPSNLIKLILVSSVCCVRAFAGGDINHGWVEIHSPHFTVVTNAGEKEGRRVADQFEQIRVLFHTALPNLRVDPAQPVLILAAKNEATMKALLPENWEVKGHVHPAGLYQPGEDKHYVVLRLDSEGANPFHALYHEYAHAILHLNFGELPLWLDEGLAEFYGNSKLSDKESRVGTIDETHLYILQQNKLLPIEVLLNVSHSSSQYNEANRASVFYAESWALVHYLLLDSEAQQRQLLKNFLNAWDKGANQLEAAQQAFGDLQRFGKVIEGYSRQTLFHVALVKNTQQAAEKDYTARGLTAGEVLSLRGDCASHRNQLNQAQPLLEQALQLEPALALAHEAMGYYKYRKDENGGADQEMLKAMELGSRSFVAPYYHGMLLLREGPLTAERVQQAVKSLQAATQLNPQFAPAFEGIARAYASSPETSKDAVGPAIQAVKLDPGEHAYTINLIYVLLNNDRTADARELTKRLVSKAASPAEAQTAKDLLQRIEEHERWAARKAEMEAAALNAKAKARASNPSEPANTVAVAVKPAAPAGPTATDPTLLMATEGTIGAMECSHKPAVMVTLRGNKPLRFHAADFRAVSVSGSRGDVPGLDSCDAWKGRKVRLWFLPVKDKVYMGEITDIALQ
jgi:Flp pilus assembly protein TadD